MLIAELSGLLTLLGLYIAVKPAWPTTRAMSWTRPPSCHLPKSLTASTPEQ